MVNLLVVVDNVIKYYPDAPKPTGTFATVNVSDITRTTMSDVKLSPSGEDVSQKVIMQSEALVSINFYRGDARQFASIIEGSMPRQSVIDLFNTNKIGFSRMSPVRDLTELESVEYEERSQIDLFILFELTNPEEIVTGIDTIRISGDFDNGNEVVEHIDIP